VDETDLPKPLRGRLLEIFLDDGHDVARGERVQVDAVLHRDAVRRVLARRVLSGHGFRRREAATAVSRSAGAGSGPRRSEALLFRAIPRSSSNGIRAKDATTAGSKRVPEPSQISFKASAWEQAVWYERFVVKAS
jgi:hypothetical protein